MARQLAWWRDDAACRWEADLGHHDDRHRAREVREAKMSMKEERRSGRRWPRRAELGSHGGSGGERWKSTLYLDDGGRKRAHGKEEVGAERNRGESTADSAEREHSTGNGAAACGDELALAELF